jgi:hypothetical protein
MKRLYQECPACHGVKLIPRKRGGIPRQCTACVTRGVVATVHSAEDAERNRRAWLALRRLIQQVKTDELGASAELIRMGTREEWQGDA